MARVLIIDDEAEFRLMARRLLEAEGYEVLEAASGSEGVEMFRVFAPDVIVTDIFMPNKSGFETIAQIRAENASVRIIAVSGQGGVAITDVLGVAALAGADETLAKPFRAQQFVDIIGVEPASATSDRQ